MPFPLHDGGAYSIYHTAMGLISQKTDVKTFAINTPKNWIDINSIPDGFIEKTKFEFSIVDTRFKPISAFFNLFSDKSYFIERFFSEKFNNDLKRILKNEEFEIVQLEHVYLCIYIDTLRKHSSAKIILRPQNVENIVWKRLLESKTNPFSKAYLQIATERLVKFEIKMAKKVDGIIAISSVDANLFKSYVQGTPIADVPFGFDFKNTCSYDYNKQFVDFPEFYHLGSMDWMPNIQGIRWFIEEVIPYIKKDYPEFIFRIAGKKMPKWFYKQQNNNLVVVGEIEDSFKFHENYAIMIVPLLSGGGIRAKIIEGMALGKVIISTAIGAEGIPYTDQENILIANSKEDFVAQINKCRNSIEFCQKISKNAKIFAKGNYDFNKTAKSMIQFYKSVRGF